MTQTVTRTRAATRGVDEAGALLEDVYGTAMTVDVRPSSAFLFGTESVSDGTFGLGRVRYSGDGATHVAPFSQFCLGVSVTGELDWSMGREKGSGLAPFLILPERPFEASWHDLDIVTLTLETRVVEDAVRARTGREGCLRTRDVNDPGLDLRYLRGVVSHLQATVRSSPDLLEDPLVRGAMREAAVQALLVSYPLVDADAASDTTTPRTVRRAVAFFDEHLAESITVADAARAAGVSVRALELGFREHLGRTPREHLRLARLAAARSALAAADPFGETVQSIARRWGFAHLSRFAQEYRRQYGELPSATLRR
jgi:AraC-like DNA-binding protein